MAIPESNGKTILITGINGYIASVLAQLLLTRGYSLRGTTRRISSSDPFLNGPWALYKDRVKIYEVPDMVATGAFDEAVKGVHGIFHTASPIDFSLTTYDEFITIAVKGTNGIFESALKAGPQLESLVVTSSVAAVANTGVEPGYVFTEKDFAHTAFDKATSDHAQGINTPAGILYAASKTAAERAVWEFRDKHNPSFAVSTVNPGVVIGPPVVLAANPAHLNVTLKPIYGILSGTMKEIPPKIGSGSHVDVRDVAKLHVWAFEHPKEANGERYIAVAGYGPPQGIADILRAEYKGTEIAKKITVGNPGHDYIGYNKETGEVDDPDFLPESTRPSGKKAAETMGITWIPFKQSVIETAKMFRAYL